MSRAPLCSSDKMINLPVDRSNGTIKPHSSFLSRMFLRSAVSEANTWSFLGEEEIRSASQVTGFLKMYCKSFFIVKKSGFFQLPEIYYFSKIANRRHLLII